jgi:hypothetical protein
VAVSHQNSKISDRIIRVIFQMVGLAFLAMGLSQTSVYAQPASSAPGYAPTALSVSSLSRNLATSPSNIRVGLISINGGMSTVENALHSTGLLDSSRIDVIVNSGGTPTLAQLEAYDAVLLWTDNAFTDPVAIGNVLADYIDRGGSVVMATFAFSRSAGNNWWVGGRFMDEEYSPFGISERRASTSGVLNLSSAKLDHPIFDGIFSSNNITDF